MRRPYILLLSDRRPLPETSVAAAAAAAAAADAVAVGASVTAAVQEINGSDRRAIGPYRDWAGRQ